MNGELTTIRCPKFVKSVQHRPVANPPAPPKATYQREDLDAVLAEWDEVLDVDADDLHALLQAVERRAQAREAGLRR